MLDRLRKELDLATLSIFGTVTSVVVAAFAVYRFSTGSLVGGFVDGGISLGLAAIVVYTWRGSDVSRAGAIFVGFAVIACVASSMVFGRTAAYWAFLVLSISFVVTGPRAALLASLTLIAAIAVQPSLFADLPERAIFIVTALLVTVFGWIFNARYTLQRRQLETLAHEDPLTSAGNRRVMRQALVDAVAARRSSGEPAVLAVLDLDSFKAVNDAHGHEEGDRVLVRFADIVRDRLRLDDGFYRLGGEEFVVLLKDTTLDQAQPVVDDLRLLVDQGMQAIARPVTASVGVASLRPDEDWSTWLKRADAAMYRAKEAGGNRVEVDAEVDQGGEIPDRRAHS